ncbi:MAG: hypothetical protein Q4D91_12540 [Lautropia sp.]|nr:hypothetical protein [Lautropia sp.]
MSQSCCDRSEVSHAVEESVSVRRQFVKLGMLAGGASLLGLSMPSAQAAGETEALLLSCMDFRLMNEIEHYMNARGLRDKYDHVVLAGASLGAVTDQFPAWNKTFWDHVDIAKKLHHIKKVIVIDHRDCGAYKVVLGEDSVKTEKLETEAHVAQLGKLRSMLKARHPELEVETLLMSLDGQVEPVEVGVS